MSHISLSIPDLDVGPWRLRRIVAADVHAVHAGLSDPQVIAHYGVSYPTLESAQVQMDWFEQIAAEGRGAWWALCQRDAPAELIGACGFNDRHLEHRRADIGYWLRPAWWGRGLMQRCLPLMIEHAFDTLGLYRLGAEVDEGNRRSHQVLLRLGFGHEGVRRGYEQKDGQALDLHLYGLLASDPRPWRDDARATD